MNKYPFRQELNTLRKQLNAAIRHQQAQGEPGKYYEGTFELYIRWPECDADPNAEQEPEQYTLMMHSYLVGPGRHYEWKGKTLEEAMEKCKKDVQAWIAGVYAE